MRLRLNLKVERLERGQTQAEIAEAIGITQSTWSRAERGMGINPGDARKIAQHFNRKVAEVWDFEGAAAA